MPAIFVNPIINAGAVLTYGSQTIKGLKTFSDGLWSSDQVKIQGNSDNIFYVVDSSNRVLLKADTKGVESDKAVTALSFTATSARSEKDNISEFSENSSDLLSKVKIVKFVYKNDPQKIPHIGFIADDSPLEVSDDHKHMDITNCIGLLIKSVQELSDRIKKLELKSSMNDKFGGY